MVSANKVLTVSYGAFSCTLEGFDDPFATMADVAAYFRDLAAEDRQFGTRPSTSDIGTLRATEMPGEDAMVAAFTVLKGTRGAVPGTFAVRSAGSTVGGTGGDRAAPEGLQVTYGESLPDDMAGGEPRDDEPERDLAEDATAIAVTGADDDVRASAEARSETQQASSPGQTGDVLIANDAADPVREDAAPVDVSEDVVPGLLAAGDGSRPDADLSHDTSGTLFGPGSVPSDDADTNAPERPAGSAGTPADAVSTEDREQHERRGAARAVGDTSPDADRGAGAARSLPADPDMERLFAATDSRLSGSETSKRHANISHLRAAVAARRADGPTDVAREARSDPYRADLASSVRNRRSPAGIDRMPQVPARRIERPAPLMLVSEQRIALPPVGEPTGESPMRRDGEAAPQEGSVGAPEGFAAFASAVGVRDLRDVLEAAAVFSTLVRKQDTFSRPQLMRLVDEVETGVRREDGLRAFGQLLRAGTIRKVGSGTFALTAGSRYAEGLSRRVG